MPSTDESDMTGTVGPELLRAMVEQASEALIYADRDGIIRLWNSGAQIIFGHTAAEALGQSLDIIIPERFRKAHWDGFNKALASGEAKYAGRVMTTRSVHKDGRKLYVEISFGLVRDASGAVVGSLAVGRDVTERQLAAAPRS